MVKNISMDVLIYWNEFKDGNYQNINTLQAELEQISKDKNISIKTKTWVKRNLKKVRKATIREKYKGLSTEEILRKTVESKGIDYEWFLKSYGFKINYNGNIYIQKDLYIHKDLSGAAVEKRIKGFIKQYDIAYEYESNKRKIEIEKRNQEEKDITDNIIKKSKDWIEDLVFVDNFKFSSFIRENSPKDGKPKLTVKFEFIGYMINQQSEIVKVLIYADYHKVYRKKSDKEEFNIRRFSARTNNGIQVKIDLERKF